MAYGSFPQAVEMALKPVKRRGDRDWSAVCPAHEDRSPSVSVRLRNRPSDGTRVALVKCFAGCPLASILSRSGLAMSDLFEHRRTQYGEERKFRPRPVEAACYDYLSATGELLCQKVRLETPGLPGKDFRWRRPDGRGGWLWNRDGVERVPYRLPQLLLAPQEAVWLCEGEKAADAAAALGLAGTAHGDGAGNWDAAAMLPWLDGRDVAVLPDNDAPGRAHAERVLGSLLRRGACRSVRLVDLPLVEEHADMHDFAAWFGAAARGMALELAGKARVWK